MKNCLLITPLGFYSWHSTIANELSSRGFLVDLMNDEYPEGLFGVLLGNFFNTVSQKITQKKFNDFFTQSYKRYDLTIIFKGRGVSSELLETISLHSDRVVGYNFDSFNYFDKPLKWFKNIDSYKTFDFVDSAMYKLQRVDLFSDHRIDCIPEKKIDISCVIKNHSDRLVYLDKIYALLGEDIIFKVFIYETNILTLFRNILQHPLLIFKWRKHIFFKGLNQAEYFKIMSTSKFTIDYAHPSQSGVTMRCFQAAACGTRVITNNDYVKETSSLNRDNFFIYKLGEDTKGLSLFVENNLFKQPLVSYRGIGDFMDDLLR